MFVIRNFSDLSDKRKVYDGVHYIDIHGNVPIVRIWAFKLTKINSNHADVRRHTFLEKSCCTVSLYLLMFENVPVSVNIFLNGSHNIVYK